MKKLYSILILTILLSSCQTSEENMDQETYTYLQVCFEDYYLNYDVEITPLLNDFEQLLVKEGHLKDTTGKAYKSLFYKLQKSNYFEGPMNKEEFNDVVLYKNPSKLIQCAERIFKIDSIQLASTNFAKVTRKINAELMEKEEVSIHYLFEAYKRGLDANEIKAPYVKQSIQILLYRWYYKSKFDPSINENEKEEQE